LVVELAQYELPPVTIGAEAAFLEARFELADVRFQRVVVLGDAALRIGVAGDHVASPRERLSNRAAVTVVLRNPDEDGAVAVEAEVFVCPADQPEVGWDRRGSGIDPRDREPDVREVVGEPDEVGESVEVLAVAADIAEDGEFRWIG